MINMMLFNPENPVILSIYRQGDHFRTHAGRTGIRTLEPSPAGRSPSPKENIMRIHLCITLCTTQGRACNRFIGGHVIGW